MSKNMSDGSGMGDSTDEILQTPHGRRAKVWEYFEPDLVIVDNVLKAVCKFCAMKLACKSGTSSLRNHVGDACPKIEDEIRNSFLATIKKKPSDVGFVFDPVKSHKLMVKYCIHAEIPFRKFEDPYFEKWMESMQPTFKVVGCHTVRNECIDEYEQMKEQLRTELQDLDSRVSLTSDMWTSVQKLGYMCITAHYIDSNFILKKKIISFKDVKYPHSSAAIEEALTRSLTEWGIKHKLFTLTLDNATNNTAAVDNFIKNQDHGLLLDGADFHVRCCAHILNILVQDGTFHVRAVIEKIRDLLRHIDSSGARVQSFNTLATNLGLPEKSGLLLDIPNCWNSTYLMITEALKYKVVLNNYASENAEPTPTEGEWTNAEVICAFLKAFEKATKAVSADRKPTAHLFLHMILCIRNALKDPQWKVNVTMEILADIMSTKFNKYWEESKLNDVLVIATVLDPTKKLDYLDFFYEKYCDNVNDIEKNVEYIKDTMKLYFEKYEGHAKRSSEQSSVSRQAGLCQGSPVLGKRKLDEEFARYKSRRRAYVQPKSELGMYLDEEFESSNENFDILLWWKTNAEKYPVLSTMARDFLAIPLSAVSAESAFSCGGRILGDTQTSLIPTSLEALVCGKDWLIKIPNKEG